jgi:hypothetical protein
MLVPRKLWFAMLAVVVLLALPAAAAKAVAHMPVGFYDDPSFRWSTETTSNLAAAQRAHTNIVHVFANWASIAPTRPKNPLSGSDPAYQLSDLDTLVRSAQYYDMQVLMTIGQTPKWANGGKTPNYPPSNMNDLTSFAHMLASRYNGTHAGFGSVAFFSVWNEPNLQLFLAPQFSSSGKIVSPNTYAKLYMAAYTGIKAGNPKALVAAGETSNRGRNHPSGGASDSVAPATFAHDLSLVAPKLPFDAWATHPYPSSYPLGPAQRVAYPNVGFSTMDRFGSDLAKWFGRKVPIWVTEYGEQTAPWNHGPVTYAAQAKDAKAALQLAQQSQYVQMFIWFIFRDSTAQTWFSGVVAANGKKKPAYSAFAATAKGIVGLAQQITGGKPFTVNMGVPVMAYYNPIGTKLGVTYKVVSGKSLLSIGQPRIALGSNGSITINVKYAPPKGRNYTMYVTVNDKHGHIENRTIALLTS